MWSLAWQNLTHDRFRFFITVTGIAFASFLMVFQGSLLYGFTLSASRVIDAVDSDIWIMAKGVPCFDFAAPLEERLREISMGVPGVEGVGRLATGWISF